MLKQILAGTAAVAAMALVTPAMASPETVNIDVTVQGISMLVVDSATGDMTIDDDSDTRMGDPSSTGSVTCGASNLAAVRLNTNVDVQGIDITFPAINDIRKFPDNNWPNETNAGVYEWFGQAVGADTNTTLGVYPFAAQDDGGTCRVTWHNDALHSTSNDSFRVKKNSASGVPGSNFGNGTHLIELGVSGQWTNTHTSQAVFAAPDVYSITFTATIFP